MLLVVWSLLLFILGVLHPLLLQAEATRSSFRLNLFEHVVWLSRSAAALDTRGRS